MGARFTLAWSLLSSPLMSHLRPGFVVAIFAVLLGGCALASQPEQGEGEGATESSEDALGAQAPIPFVLQYVGKYEGSGALRWVILRRSGTFAAYVDGVLKTGKFYGPKAPADPLKIVFVTRGERPWTATITGWQPREKMSLSRVGADGSSSPQTLVAAWANGGEDMCDSTGGAWTDDDAVRATGLFCVCPTSRSWIPSLGGCVE